MFFVTADLSDQDASARALQEAAASFGGRAPDHVFMCAGMARPLLFVDTTPNDLKSVRLVSPLDFKSLARADGRALTACIGCRRGPLM